MHAAVERLLLYAFGALRALFLLQAFSFGCAWLAVRALAPSDAPPGIAGAMRSALLTSLVFFAGGLGLVAAKYWRAPHPPSSAHEPAAAWPRVLAFTLLACAGLAAAAGAELPALWREIGALLGRIGFADALGQSGSGPGAAALLPVLLALGVPILVTSAVLASLVLPLLLLPLVAARRRLFPALLAMAFVCQLALTLGGGLAAGVVSKLAAEVTAAMISSGDAEAVRDFEPVVRGADVLAATSRGLAAPLVALLAWLAFLRPSSAAAAWFHAGSSPEREPATRAEATPAPRRPRTEAPSQARTAVAVSAPKRPARAPLLSPHRARRALAALGAALLLLGALDALRARATYAGSQPTPGARLEAAPVAVRVSFAAPLDPASSLSLTQLVLPPYNGAQPRAVELVHRVAPEDGRTLEGIPAELPAGLYRVSWQALPAAGGVPRQGSFSFGVGVDVPADEPGLVHSLLDRDAGERSRRKTLAGGALLLALGLMLPALAPRR